MQPPLSSTLASNNRHFCCGVMAPTSPSAGITSWLLAQVLLLFGNMVKARWPSVCKSSPAPQLRSPSFLNPIHQTLATLIN
jgi:hypothetical protein